MAVKVATPTEALARQVTTWRRRRKLSAQALADRIAEDGGNLTRAAISRIENGDRGVTLEEWLQLAYALAVPPPLLFLNLESGQPVAIVPGAEVHPWMAYQWATGAEAPVTSEHQLKRLDEWNDARTVIRLHRREVDSAAAVEKAEQAIAAAEYADDQEGLRVARQRHAEALRELAAILDEMVELNVTPPGMPPERLKLMQQLKLLRHPDAISAWEPPQSWLDD
jgi:transcriptional regulator with XRE-family HTH domain